MLSALKESNLVRILNDFDLNTTAESNMHGTIVPLHISFSIILGPRALQFPHAKVGWFGPMTQKLLHARCFHDFVRSLQYLQFHFILINCCSLSVIVNEYSSPLTPFRSRTFIISCCHCNFWVFFFLELLGPTWSSGDYASSSLLLIRNTGLWNTGPFRNTISSMRPQINVNW